MIWLRIGLGLCLTLCSVSAYAVPSTYIATPVVSDVSAMQLDVRITSQSAKGYCAVVTIRNVGSESHQGWQVDFDLGGNALKHLKYAKYDVSGSHVTVTPYPNEENIEKGHKSQFEFCTEGSNGPYVFQQSIRLSNHPPVATLITSYKIHTKDTNNKDSNENHDGKGKRDYCVTVIIHNQGPDNVYDWRLTFDLGTDKLVSMEHGKSDKDSGALTITPTGGHKHIKSGHERTIKYCAAAKKIACEIPPASRIRPTIQILSPVSGSNIQARQLVVSGNYSGPANTGVTVNGVVAYTDGQHFYANNVPMQLSTNTITAIATTPYGKVAQSNVNVDIVGPTILELWATPSATGIAPFKASFEFLYTVDTAIQSIAMDYDGDGVDDYSTSDPGSILEFTYSNPGLYPVRLTVTDTLGRTYYAPYAIQVLDSASMDTLFRSVYSDLIDALVCKKIESALSLITSTSRGRYQPVFEQLKPHFGEITGSFSALQSSLIRAEYAEYGINRTINGVNRLFLIYFMQDSDGVWRIDSM